MQIGSINLEVDPIEHVRLAEPQDGLAQKSVESIVDILEHHAHNRVTQHQGDEGVGSLDFVLDVDGRIELEEASQAVSPFSFSTDAVPEQGHHGHIAI